MTRDDFGTNGAARLKHAFARWARRDTPTGEDPMNDTTTPEDQIPETTDAGELPTEPQATSPTVNDLEQMTGERDALKDRLARLQAEFDNFRKREANARQDARAAGLQDAVEPFLSVMDNFALALKSGGTAEQLRAGVELILKQMEEALRTLNVQPVEAVGAQFDPHLHEALGSVETAEHPDHQVLEEIRRGYRLRDKLLRPALVRIASNPHQVND